MAKETRNLLFLSLILLGLSGLLLLISRPTFYLGRAAQKGGCGWRCLKDFQCLSGLICANGFCRNPNCPTIITCICSPPTPFPTRSLPTAQPTGVKACNESCQNHFECLSHYCYQSRCRNPICPSQSTCSCEVGKACNASCETDAQCQTYYCHRQLKVCRNINCPEITGCKCPIPTRQPITPVLTITPKPTTILPLKY